MLLKITVEMEIDFADVDINEEMLQEEIDTNFARSREEIEDDFLEVCDRAKITSIKAVR